MKLNKKIIISIILVIIWMIVIFIFSAMPSDESNEKSKYVISKAVQTVEKTTEKSTSNENINNQETEINDKSEKETQVNNRNTRITNKLNAPLRKCAHASVYFVLCIFITNAILEIKNKLKIKYSISSILISFLYACTDEFHQIFVQGRTGQFTDVLIDTSGAIIGFAIFYLIYKLIHKKLNKDREEIL